MANPCRRRAAPPSSAATASRSPAPTAPTREASNQDMLTAALEGLVARFGLAGERLGEVAAGAVLKHSRDFNLTREAVLGSSLLARTTPAYDVQQACGTGLEAAILVANKIALGQIESGIAGGVDTRLRRPDRRQRGPARDAARRSTAPRRPAQRLKALAGLRPGHARPGDPAQRRAAHRPVDGRAHGASPPSEWGISREAQDELAAASHRNLAAAYDRGFFDDLLTPYLGLTRDQNLRPDSTLEKLAQLKPVFGKGRGRHDDGRQLARRSPTAPRPCCSARDEWAARARAAACWPTSSTPRPPPSTTCTATRAC